jgi:phosphoglycerate dehydrogenase-like enzyme
MLPLILIAESTEFSQRMAECLRCGRVVLADLGRDSLLSSVRDADILWVRLRHRIDREVMEAAPRLR